MIQDHYGHRIFFQIYGPGYGPGTASRYLGTVHKHVIVGGGPDGKKSAPNKISAPPPGK